MPWRLSAVECVELLRSGQATPLQLVEACRERWEATDPLVNALPITAWDEARARARELAARGWPDPLPPGYLYGMPLVVKDVIAVKGMRFTMGSKLMADRVAQEDDPLVQRLKERGAIVVAKSNTPEYAIGSHTFNEIFGATRNPWNLALSAGGSSGGSAAALAAGSAWLATGTDLGGSLRNPAAWCCVVGLRTTPGLVPTDEPAVPHRAGQRLQSVAGPMARCVRDAALLLDAMAAPDGGGGQSGGGGAGEERRPVGRYEAAALAGAAAGAAGRRPQVRLAFSADLGGATPVDPEVAEICRAAADWFCGGGGGGGGQEGSGSGSGSGSSARRAARAPEDCPDFTDAARLFHVLRCASCQGMLALFAPEMRKNLKPDMIWQLEVAEALTEEDAAWAEARHDALLASRDEFFSRRDIMASPAAMMSPFPVEIRWPSEFQGRRFTDYTQWLLMCGAVSLLAGPGICVPCGFTAAGLPVGVVLTGPPGSEARVIEAAAAYEAAHGWARRVPCEPGAAAAAAAAAPGLN
ncbi:hypothetical protein Rsub_12471 [Raphidocelis subcapitata]|uniref:Amidase domain-containing protein n=1 Tax=Raphidocelis subcapitata TaxID=307507 RepID=A0A2V0PJL4_9CHLO|nr:hypothetical protein Rsub_12471 [Raphidocelis subcapitata]|eukprot:GBF99212.1 hypothetical protein Rsub_12471 [Raphidocelis subcapitata]